MTDKVVPQSIPAENMQAYRFHHERAQRKMTKLKMKPTSNHAGQLPGGADAIIEADDNMIGKWACASHLTLGNFLNKSHGNMGRIAPTRKP